MTLLKNRLAASLASSVICYFAAGLVPALAQTAQTAQGPEIEEVVVTARKVQENIVTVPMSITAITAEDLEAKGLDDRRDLSHFTPGFYNTPANVATANRYSEGYTARGLGAVNIFWNGVPMTSGDIPELLDLERVEVLKGPQNAFYGRSTFSGAINFIAEQPTEEFHGYADIDGATWDNKAIKAGVEDAIIPGVLSGRAAVSYMEKGPQYTNYGYGGPLGEQDTTAGTASLLFTPTDDIRVRLYYANWYEHDGPNAIAYYQVGDDNCNGGGAPAGTLNYICGPQSRAAANRISQFTAFTPQMLNPIEALATTYTVGPNYIDENGLKRNGDIIQVFADYTLPNTWTASSIFSYDEDTAGNIQDYGNRYYPNDGGGTVYNPSLSTQKFQDTYGEIRIASNPHDRLHGLLGVSYVYSPEDIQSVINKSGVISVSFPPTIIYSKTAGLFGSVVYSVFDRLDLTFEGRWQWDEVGRNTIGVNNLDATTTSFVPRAIAEYYIDQDKTLNAFISYSEGTHPAQVNTGFLALPAYAQAQVLAQEAVPTKVPEERLHNYEAGLKGEFFDHTLRLLSDVYYAQDRGRAIAAAIFYTNTAGVLAQANFTAGAGATNAAGIEEEFTWVPTHNWVFDGTFAYNYTKILSTACAACKVITGNIDPTGGSIERYPITSGTLNATYKMQALTTKSGQSYDAYYNLEMYYHGKEYADETELTWLVPYVVANARVGLENERYKFEVYGLNIFNNKVPMDIGQTPDQITGAQVISLTPPVKPTFGARLHIKF